MRHTNGDADEPIDLRRPPGYPAFVAATYGLMGRSPGNVALMQLLVGGLAVFLIYSIGSSLHSARAGLFAGLLYLLDPNLSLWSLPILSDLLYAVALVLAVYLVARWKASTSGRWLVAAGIVAGLSCLIRPIGILLLPVWTMILLVNFDGSSKEGISWRPSLTFGVVALAIVLPWMMRNKIVWDTFNVSSLGSQNLELWMAPAAIAVREGISLEEARTMLSPPEFGSAFERDRWYLTVILDNPTSYLSAHLRGTIGVLLGVDYAAWLKRAGIEVVTPGAQIAFQSGNPGRALASLWEFTREASIQSFALLVTIVFQVLLYIAGLVGFIRLWSTDRWIARFLAITMFVLIFTPGPVGESRFRVPVQPILALLAGVGLAEIFGTSSAEQEQA